MRASRCLPGALLLLLCTLQLADLVLVDAARSNRGLKPQRLLTYRTHFYQLAMAPAVGTMVLIHGCGAGARAFFPYDPVNCPECLGYPEYIAQTKLALARGYHVLALQANHEGSNCWSSSTRNGFADDRPDVVSTVSRFVRDHDLSGLPLYVQGYSSGGTMCLKLPAYLASQKGMRVDGIVAVDAAPSGGFNAEGSDGLLKEGIDFPPTLYVAMELGKARARAPDQIAFLRRNGVPADLVISPPARKIVPTFFSDRIPAVSRPQSEALVAGLKSAGALDPQGFLLPGWWLDRVPLLPWLADRLVLDSVAQEMQVAQGQHQNMGEYTAASLAWLESGGKSDVQALVRRLVPARMADVTIDQWLAGAPEAAQPEATEPEAAAPGAAAPAGWGAPEGGGTEGPAPGWQAVQVQQQEGLPVGAPLPTPTSGARRRSAWLSRQAASLPSCFLTLCRPDAP